MLGNTPLQAPSLRASFILSIVIFPAERLEDFWPVASRGGDTMGTKGHAEPLLSPIFGELLTPMSLLPMVTKSGENSAQLRRQNQTTAEGPYQSGVIFINTDVPREMPCVQTRALRPGARCWEQCGG